MKTTGFVARVLLLLAASLHLAHARLADAPPVNDVACQVTNLIPSFLTFWNQYSSADTTTQAKMFEQMVVVPNQSVYDGVFSGLTMPVPDVIAQALVKTPEHIAAIRTMNQSIESDLPGHIATFRRSFPDFQCSTPIYFLYSVGVFDGGTRDVKGTTALMFGLDVIAVTFGQDQAPLFSHELFHVYHSQVVKPDPDAIYWQVWKEGLATYVSRTLNPGLPDNKICCFPDIEATKRQAPKIAGEILEKFDSAKDEDYAKFLLGGQRDLDIPQRSGYYIGYLVAQQLGQKRSLEQLAKLPPNKVRKLEKRELERMKKQS